MRSEDPSLSPRANELLTDELQQIVGAEEVVVPEDAPRRSDERHGTHSPFVAALVSNRAILIVTFLAALVVGGIVALVTEQYWVVVVALALHAVGTLVVAVGAIGLTTETEHVDPAVAARLEEEGVSDPDRVLSDLVEDFAGARQARGVPEVVTSGQNERTTATEDGPARSSVEQRTAMTPSSGGAPAGGSRSPVAALQWWTVLGIAVLSIAFALIIGGEMWALPAIFLPLGAGWIALQFWMARGGDVPEREPGDGETATRRLLPIGVFVTVGVIWFMLVVGYIADLL